MTSTPIIDIHLHPTLKPYGNSFYSNLHNELAGDPSCIFTQDKHTGMDDLLENILGIPRYRESDFTTLVDGQVKLICAALYPIETGFFKIKQKLLAPFEEQLGEFASLLGKKRIDFVMGDKYNYFEDLCNENAYLNLLNGKPAISGSLVYDVISSASEIDKISNLLVIPTIEGAHSFCNGTDTTDRKNWHDLQQNVSIVKKWASPPLFVTLGHHFYNGLCTHAKSLFEVAGELLDQSYGMRDYDLSPTDHLEPINDIGMEIIDLLLSEKNGRRILIDVKHMSLSARKKYYEILKENYNNENIPIIWSHGAIASKRNNFYYHEINMELETDVKTIYESDGLIGLEIDQRILGYNHNRFSKWVKDIFISKEQQAYKEAFYFWQQIIAIAEYAYSLDKNGDPWKCICLGSDFDGIINPMNAYRDAGAVPTLYRCLIDYLNKYWKNKRSIIPKNYGSQDAQDVIYRIMYKNAYDFIAKNYQSKSL